MKNLPKYRQVINLIRLLAGNTQLVQILVKYIERLNANKMGFIFHADELEAARLMIAVASTTNLADTATQIRESKHGVRIGLLKIYRNPRHIWAQLDLCPGALRMVLDLGANLPHWLKLDRYLMVRMFPSEPEGIGSLGFFTAILGNEALAAELIEVALCRCNRLLRTEYAKDLIERRLRLYEKHGPSHADIVRREYPPEADGRMPTSFFDARIEVLGLPTWICGPLDRSSRNEMMTIRVLCNCTASVIESLLGCQKEYLAEVEKAMAEFGLSLRAEDDGRPIEI